MPDWKLTDEEMHLVCAKYRPDIVCFSEGRAVELTAQQKLAKWLQEHDISMSVGAIHGELIVPDDDWQALCKELGVK